MGQKKKNKIILISIILLVICILLVGISYAYFATDIFKSNKNLFFKYITQISDEKEGLIETSLKEYLQKQKNTPYLDDGSITVNITAKNGQEQFSNTNNMNLTFEGQVDKKNKQVEQNISLNYLENVKFPLSYKKIGDTIGMQTTYIGNKYITTKLEESGTLTNIDTTASLEKMQELTNVPFSKEDWQYIKDTYLKVCNQQLQDNNFSKIEEANSKGYKLALNGEELKSFLVKLLETLKNDQRSLDKINEYIKAQKNSSKITASSIDNLIKDINNNTELNDQNLEITVYQNKGELTSLVIKINEVECKIQKTVTANDLQYNIEIQTNTEIIGKVGLIAKFAGLQTMQNITENYELTLEMEEMKYQYNYNNNVEFTQDVSIEAFQDENTLKLDEMEAEERNNFISAVIERIQSVNQSQMQELGVEETQNPLIYIIPQFDFVSSGMTSMNTVDFSEVEVNTFNQKFENYESTNLQGVTVKGLISTIQLNNEAQEDRNRKITEIHFAGEEYETTEQNLSVIKDSIELETAYRVEFERDEDTGVIYRAVINKK